MKTLKLTLLLVLICSSTFAGNNRISASYDIMWLKDDSNISPKNFSGASLSYSRFLSLTKSSPLYLELSAKATYAFYDYEESHYDIEDWVFYDCYNLFMVSVPVNVGYIIPLSKKIYISPYVGLNYKINVIASYQKVYQDGYNSSNNYNIIYDLKDKSETSNPWNFSQLGMQVGLGMNISHLYIGAEFNRDLTNIADKTFSYGLNLKAGINF